MTRRPGNAKQWRTEAAMEVRERIYYLLDDIDDDDKLQILNKAGDSLEK